MTTRKPRERDWNHAETLVLAEERRRNNKDGVWNAIALAVSNRFPEQDARSPDACQNRWDILRKLYNRIEPFCKQKKGGHHLLLSKDDFQSMKLPTAYRSDWYNIVKELYDCKLAAKNAKIQRQKLENVTEAHWDQWAEEAFSFTSEIEPAIEPPLEPVVCLPVKPEIVERASAARIPGDYTPGVSPIEPYQSALLQSISQSTPGQENTTTISSASNQTGDSEQRNLPKT